MNSFGLHNTANVYNRAFQAAKSILDHQYTDVIPSLINKSVVTTILDHHAQIVDISSIPLTKTGRLIFNCIFNLDNNFQLVIYSLRKHGLCNILRVYG